MLIMRVGQFVNSISGSTGNFMDMPAHEKAYGNIILVAAVISVRLNFALVSRWGIEGAAVADMASVLPNYVQGIGNSSGHLGTDDMPGCNLGILNEGAGR